MVSRITWEKDSKRQLNGRIHRTTYLVIKLKQWGWQEIWKFKILNRHHRQSLLLPTFPDEYSSNEYYLAQKTTSTKQNGYLLLHIFARSSPWKTSDSSRMSNINKTKRQLIALWTDAVWSHKRQLHCSTRSTLWNRQSITKVDKPKELSLT